MRYLTFGLFFAAVAAWSQDAPSFAASFDCSQASSEVELAICGDEGLAKLDVILSDMYQGKLRHAEGTKSLIDELRSSQREWLVKRDACNVGQFERCIEAEYRKRLDQLDPIPIKIEQTEYETIYITYTKWTNNSVITSFANALIDDPIFVQMIEDAHTQAELIFEAVNMGGDQWHAQNWRFVPVFNSPKLAVVEEIFRDLPDEGDGSWHWRARYFDRVQNKEIAFADIFDPASADFVSELLADSVMGEVARINRRLNVALDAAQGETSEGRLNYFGDLPAILESRTILDWKNVAMYRTTYGVKFVVNSNSYEYSDFDYGYPFRDMRFDTAPFIPFIKPEYRDSFVSK